MVEASTTVRGYAGKPAVEELPLETFPEPSSFKRNADDTSLLDSLGMKSSSPVIREEIFTSKPGRLLGSQDGSAEQADEGVHGERSITVLTRGCSRRPMAAVTFSSGIKSPRDRSFPPLMSSLARQQSKSRFPSQMPLFSLQSIREHGRFVLHELKVPKQLMFQPIRKDGRLILRLQEQEEVEETSVKSNSVSDADVEPAPHLPEKPVEEHPWTERGEEGEFGECKSLPGDAATGGTNSPTFCKGSCVVPVAESRAVKQETQA